MPALKTWKLSEARRKVLKFWSHITYANMTYYLCLFSRYMHSLSWYLVRAYDFHVLNSWVIFWMWSHQGWVWPLLVTHTPKGGSDLCYSASAPYTPNPRLTLESNKGNFFQYSPTFLNLAYTKACGAAKLRYTDRIRSGNIEKISSRCLGIFSSYQQCLFLSNSLKKI